VKGGFWGDQVKMEGFAVEGEGCMDRGGDGVYIVST